MSVSAFTRDATLFPLSKGSIWQVAAQRGGGQVACGQNWVHTSLTFPPCRYPYEVRIFAFGSVLFAAKAAVAFVS